MKRENRALLFLICAGMELGYLYACANFVTTSVFHQTFPFPEAVGSFLLAALLTLFSDGRGWRVIYVLGLQALGFVPALLRIVSLFRSWSDSFVNQTWFTEFFTRPSDAVEYFVFVLAIAWILAFWVGGVELARRQKDYPTICSRFDRGLIAFFILFLTKFYLQTVQGIPLNENTSGFFVIPFLIFSLLAIGLAQNRSAAQKDFLPGYRTIGVLLGLIVVTLLVGIGLVFFCLPYLTLAAEKGNDILQVVTRPVLAILFLILNWLFSDAFSQPSDLPVPQSQPPVVSTPWNIPGWVEFIGKILTGAVVIVVSLVLLAVLGGLLYAIVRWLFSRTTRDQERQSPRGLLSAIISQIRAVARFLWRGPYRHVKGYRNAAQLYAALRTWGRHSGLPHFVAETPAEYGLRLERRFPILAREVELIVAAFNREVYGEIVLNEPQLVMARSAWRRLASPLHWFLRLKTWLLQSRHLSET